MSGINKNDKIGIVGSNGVGKSTLLNIIGGKISIENGRLNFFNNPNIGFSKQEVEFNSIDFESSILEYLKKYSGYAQLEEKIQDFYKNPANFNNKNLYNEFELIYGKFEKLGGYNFEYNVDSILEGISGSNLKKYFKIKNLSGGQKNKVLLSLSLLQKNDILLLDESTNNLDIKSVDWLINFIKNLDALVLFVSHDKYFLNNLSNKILEIKEGKINIFSGNYDFYELEKNNQKNKLLKQNSEYLDLEKQLDEKLKKLNSKRNSVSNVNSKKRKDNDKFIPNFNREIAQNKTGDKIKKLKKDLNQLSKEKPNIQKEKPFFFNFKFEEKLIGGVYLNNIIFNYKDSDFGINVDKFSIENGEKILLLGNNAAGKTTLLKIINGELSPNYGNIKISPSIKIGNFSQEKLFLDNSDYSVIEYFEKNLHIYKFSEINNILSKFSISDIEKNQN